MPENIHIKDHGKEKTLFLNRILISSLVALFLLIIIIIRLIQLQVFEYDTFNQKAQGNRINLRATLSPRGTIFDRNGNTLAENITAFELMITPEQVINIEETMNNLLDLELINPIQMDTIRKKIQKTQKFRSITLRSDLNDQEIARFAANRANFPGIDLQPKLIRHYPHKNYTSHVVGYVGSINKKDQARLNQSF